MGEAGERPAHSGPVTEVQQVPRLYRRGLRLGVGVPHDPLGQTLHGPSLSVRMRSPNVTAPSRDPELGRVIGIGDHGVRQDEDRTLSRRCSVRLPWVRLHPLLIEPDVLISHVRLSVEIMPSPTAGVVSSAQGA